MKRWLTLCLTVVLLASCNERGQPASHATSATLISLLPAHVVAGYYPSWSVAPMRLREVNVHYNLITVFLQQHSEDDSTATLGWIEPDDGRAAASNFISDLQYVRKVQNRKIIFSVASLGSAANFSNRAAALTFVAQLALLYQKAGGYDGLEWGALQVAQRSDFSQMVWVSQELKQRYPGFIIGASALPGNLTDRAFSAELLRAGVLDYAAPQFYDGANMVQDDQVLGSVGEWSALLGAGHVVVGLGINSAANYQSTNRATVLWQKIAAGFPGIRGGSDWDIAMDERQGWVFADGIGARILGQH